MGERPGSSGLGRIGIPDGEPRVICDDCGTTQGARRRDGRPYAWLLDGKAPPGWAMVRREDAAGVWRRDYRGRCRVSALRAYDDATGGSDG